MSNLKLLAQGLNVAPIYWALQAHPELWNKHTTRTENPTSPHHGLDDIWVRYGDSDQDPAKPHTAKWYEPADIIGIKTLCLDVMRSVGGSILGGVLITRIPPGASCKPHSDNGWHADAHHKYAVQITSAPGQKFCFDGEELESKPGDLFWFDNQFTHWVTNDTPYERITLIICVRKE
jgi:quercetin dioxygenase-like cupin family protein